MQQRRFVFCALHVSLVFLLAASVQAQSTVMSVKESWELVMDEPDDTIVAPQFNTVMSPVAHLNGYYGIFTLNYADIPAFVAGGMQIQLWHDNVHRNYMDIPGTALNTLGERITWNQVLKLENGILQFGITGGSSASWGTFGDKDQDFGIKTDYDLVTTDVALAPVDYDGLAVDDGSGDGGIVVTPTFNYTTETGAPELTNLNGYSRALSVERTRRWGYSRKRILTLKLLRVQQFDGQGQRISDDTTVTTVLPN